MADGGRPADPDDARPSGDPRVDDPLWDDWDTSLTAPAVPLLHLDGFDGPMDLLLDLAERQRIDLGRLSIVALAQQFVAELEGRLRGVAIERRADWVVVAARLMHLRSRLLLPADPVAAADAARDAARMIADLEAMRFMRAAASWLDARPQLGRDIFVRPLRRSPQVASYMALMEACLTVIAGRGGAPDTEAVAVYRVAVRDLWRVGDAIARIRAQLQAVPVGDDMMGFVPELPERASLDRPLRVRVALASTLLACLELARDGELRLDQRSDWGTIDVSRSDITMISDRMTMGSD
jgi:segregation and condensation protein A